VLTRREEKLVRSLAQRKNREAEGRFLVEGMRVVEDLLASELEVHLLLHTSSLEDTERGRTLLEAADARGVPLRRVEDKDLSALADTQTPQGVLAVARSPSADLADLEAGAERAVVLALDAVQDPGNFGTLARTAEALGAVGLLVLPGTVDPWNAKAVRSAMGASFRMPVVSAGWETASPWLEEHGFQILAADAGGEPIDGGLPARSVLVVGNEGAGLSVDTLGRADRTVGIPLRGRAESLNVAAAAAILLHELLR